MGDFPYTLEVSSPGVDRPLTDPRHWRRAVGRLVQVAVTDAGASGSISGRVLAADSDGVTLDVEGTRRRFGYPVLGPGPSRRSSGTRNRSLERPAMDIDLTVLRSLESEKDISLDQAIKAIEDALLVAYHKSEGASTSARVEVDRKSGHVTVWAIQTGPDGTAVREYDDTPAGFAGSPPPPPGR